MKFRADDEVVPLVRYSITQTLECVLCRNERPVGMRQETFAVLKVGHTERGFQVWCDRHNANVAHVDFYGMDLLVERAHDADACPAARVTPPLPLDDPNFRLEIEPYEWESADDALAEIAVLHFSWLVWLASGCPVPVSDETARERESHTEEHVEAIPPARSPKDADDEFSRRLDGDFPAMVRTAVRQRSFLPAFWPCDVVWTLAMLIVAFPLSLVVFARWLIEDLSVNEED